MVRLEWCAAACYRSWGVGQGVKLGLDPVRGVPAVDPQRCPGALVLEVRGPGVALADAVVVVVIVAGKQGLPLLLRAGGSGLDCGEGKQKVLSAVIAEKGKRTCCHQQKMTTLVGMSTARQCQSTA